MLFSIKKTRTSLDDHYWLFYHFSKLVGGMGDGRGDIKEFRQVNFVGGL